MTPLSREFFERDPVTCARELVGAVFQWDGCAGVVVETEAYSEEGDEACHTFFRPSARKFVETHPAGTAYVYLNYGMYWLTNVLVKNGSENGFVLLRALRPLHGLDEMKRRRRREKPEDLCSGPGKLSMALGITGEDHGQPLVASRRRGFQSVEDSLPVEVVACPRIGISRAKELPWRFLESACPHVSVKASTKSEV